MNPVRTAILVIAAVAAIALAFVLRGALAPKPRKVEATAAASPTLASEPSVQVLIAQTDLAVGRRLSGADVAWQAWPAKALNPAFITDGSAAETLTTGAAKIAKSASQTATSVITGGPLGGLEGATVREPFLKGEPIVQRKLVRADASGFMAVVLSPGTRAASISVSVDTAAGGFILPGDRVDVLLSRQADGKDFSSQTVMQNLKVLAIDQSTEAGKDAKSMIGAVATLEVPAQDAELMARAQAQAKSNGVLSLVLRSYADTAAPSGAVTRDATGAAASIAVFRGATASEVTVTR